MTDYKLVPIPPTPEMVEAAEDAYMPLGDMDLAIRMAVLTAPDVQGEPVAVLLIDEPERTERGLELGDWDIEPNATTIEAFARLAGPGAYQLYLAPQPAEQPEVSVPEIIEAVANFVGSQEGGPFTPPVIKAAIIGQLEYGDAFTKLFTSPAPQPAEQKPAPDVAKLVEALELALEYWSHRQQRYKNRRPKWVITAEDALAELERRNQQTGGGA